MEQENLIQATAKEPVGLRPKLGLKKAEAAPAEEVAPKPALNKKAEGGEKLDAVQSDLMKRIIMAKTLKRPSKNKKRTLMSATAQ